MFKKFLIAFAFALLAVPAVDTFAYSYSIYPEYGYYRYEIYDSDPVPVVTKTTYSDGAYFDVYARLLNQSLAIYSSVDQALDAALLDTNLNFNSSVSTWSFPVAGSTLFGQFINHTGGDLPFYDPPEPDPPEPGTTWLSDLWEWFLWQLGINDDYSGDIDAYITGGDREPFELVTPSPTPLPPSPTPIVMPITDTNGNTIWNVIYPQDPSGGGGGDSTNNYYGDEFDIFDVDLKIGDGGSSNPRDGLNDVMDTSLTYLSDPENVDMKPVGDSFSIIPDDWFLLLGVVACFPFIAGFISKLLK